MNCDTWHYTFVALNIYRGLVVKHLQEFLLICWGCVEDPQ